MFLNNRLHWRRQIGFPAEGLVHIKNPVTVILKKNYFGKDKVFRFVQAGQISFRMTMKKGHRDNQSGAHERHFLIGIVQARAAMDYPRLS